MRKNTQRAYALWRAGKGSPLSERGKSVWTDGQNIYSYATILVAYAADADCAVFNATPYSVTTTTQQSGLRTLLKRDFLYRDLFVVCGIERGDARASSLLDACAALQREWAAVADL
jgi:hypothetical protein